MIKSPPAATPDQQPTSVHERTAAFLMPVRRRRLDIVTPEGVRLHVELGDFGERAAAFLIDVVLIVVINIVLITAAVLVAGAGLRARLAISLTILVGFLVRSLYFVRFELAWRGATPGKRLIGLRVIDRRGGPLLPSAVITRNITREVETFLPLMALLGARVAGTWGAIALLLWLLLLAGVPLFTRNRARVGDLLAGTVVITVPKRVLSADLIESSAAFSFTDRQLRAYGAFELQILEEVLRRPAGADTSALYEDVCARICRRIEWMEPIPPRASGQFLRAFYAAQRAHLEREQLFGRAKQSKEELLF
jgi:uncharacterized RDD family membrane protein YckC